MGGSTNRSSTATIQVRGAREHNLVDLDLDLPLGALIVVAGRSGSGKSSLAFDTIHREGQRRYLEALLVDRRLRRPDVAQIIGLPPSIGLDQRERAFAASLTVGALCEVEPVLGVLYGRTGTVHCPGCGELVDVRDPAAITAALMELPEGTRLTVEAPVGTATRSLLDELQRAGFSRVRAEGAVVRLDELDRLPRGEIRVVVDRIKVAPSRVARVREAVSLAARAGRGAVVAVHTATQRFVVRPHCLGCRRDLRAVGPELFHTDARQERWGLGPEASAVRVEDLGYEELLRMPVAALRERVLGWSRDGLRGTILRDLLHRLDVLTALGLGHLDLGRPASAVSRGEAARLRLARPVSNRVGGVLFVLDEPAAGLDAGNAQRVVGVLRRLVDAGNTVIAVDHHPTLVRAADHVVELGPGVGPEGGRVVFQGPPEALRESPTGRLLRGELAPPSPFVGGSPVSLAGYAVDRPGITVLEGPSGCGKTRALERIAVEGRARFDRVVLADVGSIGRARRSSVATFVGLWTPLRDLLAQTRVAREHGLSPSAFSLNAPGGRCERCAGEGRIRIEMAPLPDRVCNCPACDGRRFGPRVLDVRWKGYAPDELLALTVREAASVLAGHPGLERLLRAAESVGLGHLPLGRSTRSLSGGEMRRLRLARELGRTRRPDLVVADDPSLGLHPVDTVELMESFARLAEEGSAVVLASSDPWVVAGASRRIGLDA